MILNLISLQNVKLQLGIASTAYDAQITAMIPIVSSDIRRILNCSFDKTITATISSGSSSIFISNNNYWEIFGNAKPPLELGTIIYNPSIPSDTYLLSYNPDNGYYTMSATATGAGDYIIPSINISQFPTISKMIWYKVSKMNTTDSIASGVQSESYGPVSITYSDREINKKWDYPNQLIDDLGEPYVRIG